MLNCFVDGDTTKELTAYLMWKEVEARRDNKTTVTAMMLHERLLDMRCKEGENPVEFYKNLDQCLRQIKQITGEEPFKEKMKALILLRALPSDMGIQKELLKLNDNVTVEEIK